VNRNENSASKKKRVKQKKKQVKIRFLGSKLGGGKVGGKNKYAGFLFSLFFL